MFSQAQWPIFENTEENHRLESLKNTAYAGYARIADHLVRQVELPWGERSLPGWLHLPPGASTDEPVGCVISIGGMDSAKEMLGTPWTRNLASKSINELTYIADWFADCLAGRTPDSVLTLVGQDGRIR